MSTGLIMFQKYIPMKLLMIVEVRILTSSSDVQIYSASSLIANVDTSAAGHIRISDDADGFDTNAFRNCHDVFSLTIPEFSEEEGFVIYGSAINKAHKLNALFFEGTTPPLFFSQYIHKLNEMTSYGRRCFCI